MRQHQKGRVLLVSLWIFAILFLSVSVVLFFRLDPVTVSFLDIGQGDACLIRAGSGGNVLIDGGDESSGTVLTDYFHLENMRQLDAVFISHFHEDHASGIYELMQSGYPIKRIYTAAYTGESELEDAILALAKERSIPVQALNAGDTLTLGDASYEVLYPSRQPSSKNLNNYSMILRMECENTAFLFTGDIESEAAMILAAENGSALSCDVLKVPHHGGKSSAQEDLLHACGARLAVISVAARNRYGEPSSKMLSLLQKDDIGTFRTDRDGTVVMTLGDSGILNIRTMSAKRQ